MQRILCSVLSLAIITSSLAGCSTPPVRPAVTGPQVYGYTLNQQLSGEQFQGLTDSGKRFVGSLRLYHPSQQDGRLLGLYADSKLWLDTVTSTSQEFSSESDCQAAQQADEAQLKTLIDDFNARQARPAGAPRQLGDVYASQSLDACQRIGGPGPGGEAFRYTTWATLQTETLAPRQGFPRKVEDTSSKAWDIALVIALVPIVVVAYGVAGIAGMGAASSCRYIVSPKECDKQGRGTDY
ncbi:hypothetical protein NUH87_27970 [Pseudomonas batumici]|uniref:hypothetical protein n=1 Tax=Pseudomonas batumici TaxID=226910 RepID=UPI0030D3285B